MKRRPPIGYQVRLWKHRRQVLALIEATGNRRAVGDGFGLEK